MHIKITFREILSTIHTDLIGKDSQRGITLTYGWFANQVGHFSLGFIPTFIVYTNNHNALKSMLYVGLFWFLFEGYNVLSPLYKKEYKGNGSFKVDWKNLLFDVSTDLSFFWTGGVIFYLLVHFNISVLIAFLGAFFLLLFAVRYWFLTKLYQQNALFPYQFRLSQWNAKLSHLNIDTVNKVISRKESKTHFLIFGSKGKGKTRLMVGLGNELAIKNHKTTYSTFSKWVSMLEESDQTLKETSFSLWNWTQAEFLIIDDINPGSPEISNKTKSSDIQNYLKTTNSDRNIKALVNKSVAWVVGSCAETEKQEDWIRMLENIGVNSKDIHIVDLDTI